MSDLLSIEQIIELSNKVPKFSTKLRGVYFLFKNNDLVYIGKTINLFQRLVSHGNNKEFDYFAFLEMDMDIIYIEQVEAEYIRKYKPPLNKNGKTDKVHNNKRVDRTISKEDRLRIIEEWRKMKEVKKSAVQQGRWEKIDHKIKERLAMIRAIGKWPKRLESLKNKKGMRESVFCDTHGLPRSGFNRMKKGVVTPTKANFEKVEAALKAEGV